MAEYSQQWWFSTGQVAASQRAAVFLDDQNTYAQIFADPAMTIPLSNPTVTDIAGVLTFYAEEAYYWIFVGAVDKGDSALERVGPSSSLPVFSVNNIGPDDAGNVELDAADIGAQPIGTIDALGDLYVGTGPDATTRLPRGNDGQVLATNAAAATGLEWKNASDAPVLSVNETFPDVNGNVQLIAIQLDAQPIGTMSFKGDLYVGIANDDSDRLGAGTDGQILSANSTEYTGLEWIDPPSAPVTSVNTFTGDVVLDAADVGAIGADIVDAKGDLITATAADTPVRLPVGVDGEVLTADSSDPSGLAWSSPAGTGDVDGPASSTDNAITRFDGVTGKLIQNSGATLSDDGTFNLPDQTGPFGDVDGDLYYDGDRKAVAFANGTSPLIIGQQNILLVHNDSGDVLPIGMPVYITGHVEAYPYPPTVDRAQADDEVTARAVGLCMDSIPDGADGFVMLEGIIDGYPTAGYNAGEYLYVSPVAAGGLTTTRPVPPDYATCVGQVGAVDNVHGSIIVFRAEANIGDGDVQGPASATDNALARYDGISGKLIQDSGVTLSDGGTVTLPGQSGVLSSPAGSLHYDTDYQALAFEDNIRPIQLDRQTVLRVNNPVGETLSRGTAVYINGHIDVFPYTPTVAPANAGFAGSAYAVGLCADNINGGNDGYVILEGLLENFPTLAWNYGDYVYVATGSTGALTTTRPAAPNYALPIAQVSVVSLTHGALTVLRSEATLGWGTANQIRGINAAGTAEEYKTISGTASRLTVTQGVGSVTLDVSSTLSDSKVDKSTLAAKGSLISATGAATPTNVGVGADGTVLTANSATASGLAWATNAGGDVVGPASAVDNRVARFDSTTGKLIQSSTVTISDTGVIDLPSQASVPAHDFGQLFVYQGDLQFHNGASSMSVHIGRQTIMEATNSGALINAFRPVYISGTFPGFPPTAEISQASNSSLTTAKVVGLTAHDAPASLDCYLVTSGTLYGVDTSAFTAGDALYLGSTAGTITNVRPAAPAYVTRIGSADRIAVAGTIQVSIEAPVLGWGTANQVRGMNAAATGEESKTITGTAGRLTVTQGVGSVTLDVDTTLTNTFVTGPASATDNALARFDATTGKLVQNSGVTLSDTGTLVIPGQTAPTPVSGQLFYDNDALNFTNFYVNEVTLRIGRQNFVFAFNSSGSTIPTGAAVYMTSTGSSNIALARADVEATSHVLGLAAHPIENNTAGLVTINGAVYNINTSAFTQGDVLYLSASSAGTLTTTKPSAPNFVVKVGTVVYDNALGSIDVNISRPLLGAGSNGYVEVAKSSVDGGKAVLMQAATGVIGGAGRWPAGGVVVSRFSGAMTLNTMYLIPFSVLRDINMSIAGFEVVVGVASSVMRGGVYAADSVGLPTGSPISTFSSTVNCDTIGDKTFSNALNFTGGSVYYLAVVGQTAAPNIRFTRGFSPYVAQGTLTGTEPGLQNCYAQAGVTGALPAVAAFGVYVPAFAPLVYWGS